ncbi:MAG: HAD hydrolase-like protein [Anaerolineae bacterium]|nr:HAD hydrolase-like protein [Anaerolineae bacterium]
MTSKPIELILFDIDGTLVMTRGAGRQATKLAMLDVFGTDAGLDTHHFGGKTDWRTLYELLAHRAFSEDELRGFIPQYEAAIGGHLERIIGDYEVTPCTASYDFVLELRRRGTPLLGILTGNVSTTAPVKLRAAGFDLAWFPVAAYGSEALERDDLPALAVARAETLLGHKIAPEQVVIIGDTSWDVACARALGAVAVAVLTGFTSRDDLAATKPDFLLDDLSQFIGRVME